jgi:transposase
MNITVVGLDIAKNVFVLCGLNQAGKPVLQRKLSRAKVLSFFANLPVCLIGIEACPGAHYWARELLKFGHQVKLVPAQYVQPFVRGDKTDARDARAIAEAITRPDMTFVQINNHAQQDLQMVHRVRQRLVKERTALLLQIRGLLNEYGIVFPQGSPRVAAVLRELLADTQSFSGLALAIWHDLLVQLQTKEQQVAEYDVRIQQLCRDTPQANRLQQTPGIGPLTATAFVAAFGNASHYASGRKLAACLGLVPREHSSGGKQQLLGISKRGNVYLRTLLIHGARTLLRYADKKTDRLSRWACSLKARKGFNVAAVALANKLARIAWAMLSKDADYDVLLQHA